MGNHDYACLDQRSRDEMIRNGRESIDYTKRVLTPESFDLLENYPDLFAKMGFTSLMDYHLHCLTNTWICKTKMN